MPDEEEDEADDEEPPVILVDELKPIPLNCSNIIFISLLVLLLCYYKNCL